MRKRSWCLRNESPKQQPKKDIHVKKVMLCVWWDYKGIIYYQILPQNQTVNSDVYCRQLSNLAEKLERLRPELANRKGVVFQQDNARPHVSLATEQSYMNVAGMFYLTHHIHLTLLHLTTSYFCLCKTHYKEKALFI